MEIWQPNKLVQDDTDVAYQPTDREGKQLAARLTLYLNLLMWRVKMDAQSAPLLHGNYRCSMRPITPRK